MPVRVKREVEEKHAPTGGRRPATRLAAQPLVEESTSPHATSTSILRHNTGLRREWLLQRLTRRAGCVLWSLRTESRLSNGKSGQLWAVPSKCTSNDTLCGHKLPRF